MMPELPIIRLRRPIPPSEVLAWRAGYLHALRWVIPKPHAAGEPAGLVPGNKKTGTSGTIYKSVLVWNLPSVGSCPGASAWCLRHCYNADPRDDVFPVSDWADNFAWVMHAPSELQDKVLTQLKTAQRRAAVRLHSSGDFFSAEYIALWNRIATEVPDVDFWAYTRSWILPELLPELERLRQLANVQMFASWDPTMPPAPAGWRLSLVTDNAPRAHELVKGEDDLVCPEQTEDVPNCASCGYCIRDMKGNVIFFLH